MWPNTFIYCRQIPISSMGLIPRVKYTCGQAVVSMFSSSSHQAYFEELCISKLPIHVFYWVVSLVTGHPKWLNTVRLWRRIYGYVYDKICVLVHDILFWINLRLNSFVIYSTYTTSDNCSVVTTPIFVVLEIWFSWKKKEKFKYKIGMKFSTWVHFCTRLVEM